MQVFKEITVLHSLCKQLLVLYCYFIFLFPQQLVESCDLYLRLRIALNDSFLNSDLSNNALHLKEKVQPER